MKTYMFPGQGSQSRGMGEKLFDRFSEATEKADNILGFSIKELCLEDPRRELSKTQFTQPAIYVVNALSYYAKLEDTGITPDYVAGHSLGEFNALLAARCYDFEDGLRLVKKRGELMSQAPKGAMAAILNATKEQIESILEKNGLHNIDLANYNTPSQIVISGSADEIGKAQDFFGDGGMLYYPLNTGGAFHSRFMQPIKEEFFVYLKDFKFSDLKIPVISNVTALPYKNEDIVKNLSDQLSNCVHWSSSIQYLMGLESNSGDAMEFEEVGSGEVLTKIYRTIKAETSITIKNPSIESDVTKITSNDNGSTSNQNIEKASISDDSKSGDIFIQAEKKVKAWNLENHVGTRVKSALDGFDELETRTQAMVLFGHRAAVYMKGYHGYFDLDEITVA
jgi:malonyl CoA-acyl carrier protein transacylase